MRRGFEVWFGWHLVWVVPMLGVLLLSAPLNRGYIPRSPLILTLVGALGVALFVAAGRSGMRVVLRHSEAGRPWLIPAFVNVELPAFWLLSARAVTPESLLFCASTVAFMSLGMWLAIREDRVDKAGLAASNQVEPLA